MDELLTAHVDALNKGIDQTDWLITQHPKTAELPELLHLAQWLQVALVPLQARLQFVSALEEQLRQAKIDDEPETTQRWVWWGLAALGSMMAGAGILGIVFWRRARPTAEPVHS